MVKILYYLIYFYTIIHYTTGHTSTAGEAKEVLLEKDLCSNKDKVLRCDVISVGKRNLLNKTKFDTASYKILHHKRQQECIDSNNDFFSIDQITTPAHASFENELEYQNVLMNVFWINLRKRLELNTRGKNSFFLELLKETKNAW